MKKILIYTLIKMIVVLTIGFSIGIPLINEFPEYYQPIRLIIGLIGALIMAPPTMLFSSQKSMRLLNIITRLPKRVITIIGVGYIAACVTLLWSDDVMVMTMTFWIVAIATAWNEVKSELVLFRFDNGEFELTKLTQLTNVVSHGVDIANNAKDKLRHQVQADKKHEPEHIQSAQLQVIEAEQLVAHFERPEY
jgi:hypothetical protein